jgi:hypothetical protein
VAEFALFGQFSQMLNDAQGVNFVRGRHFPFSYAWATRFLDLSGLEGAAGGAGVGVSEAQGVFLGELLSLIAQTYLPFLRANHACFGHASKSKMVSATLWKKNGAKKMSHSQPRFRYQKKCYETLLHHYTTARDVKKSDDAFWERLLIDSGCADFFENFTGSGSTRLADCTKGDRSKL